MDSLETQKHKHTRKLQNLTKEDKNIVGGKSANLGELNKADVPVPPGFTTTSRAYTQFLKQSQLKQYIKKQLKNINTKNVQELKQKGKKIREKIKQTPLPPTVKKQIKKQYDQLSKQLETEEPNVAVRSSATAEDLPNASFAGQQETFLNVSGTQQILEKIRECYASLFTDRAISYREDKNFSHLDIKVSCVIQKMAEPRPGASGVIFTMDPDSGFEKVHTIEASYGLGELIVQGEIKPDTYTIFKETNGIIEKKIGEKKNKMIRKNGESQIEKVPEKKREQPALNNEQIKKLAEYATKIEKHYGQNMDIEWVLDTELDKIFIVQARPETVHSDRDKNIIENHVLQEEGEKILEGVAIGDKIGTGRIKKLENPSEMEKFEEGDILVTERTDPDWEPVMKKSSGIITNQGGKTSHAAIVSRELGVPAIVGTGNATKKLEQEQEVTVDCTKEKGTVYQDKLSYKVEKEELEEIPETETDVMLILGDPSSAFNHSDLPVDGVGLAREEFIINSHVGEHPLHLIENGREEEFKQTLKTGIAKIAAAFYPEEIIVRLSDFKTDEYRKLEGGEKYEEKESNPMLGWRGASRYYDERFSEAFDLECQALKQVIEHIGLDNVKVMVPFCRTLKEAREVKSMMKEKGLGENVETYVMAELPSNIKLADKFGEIFDGFSIGSNDLTQLTLGVDRNSEELAHLFQEDNEAVKRFIEELMQKAEKTDSKVGICGDAPSTVDGYTEFLVEQGVDSISVSPDVALETMIKVAEAEKA